MYVCMCMFVCVCMYVCMYVSPVHVYLYDIVRVAAVCVCVCGVLVCVYIYIALGSSWLMYIMAHGHGHGQVIRKLKWNRHRSAIRYDAQLLLQSSLNRRSNSGQCHGHGDSIHSSGPALANPNRNRSFNCTAQQSYAELWHRQTTTGRNDGEKWRKGVRLIAGS